MADDDLKWFACPACGNTYAWTPELVGKRVRCDCGKIVAVPKSAPPPKPGGGGGLQQARGSAGSGTTAAPAMAAGATAVAGNSSASKPRRKAPVGRKKAGPHRYASEQRNYGRIIFVVVLLIGAAFAYTYYSRPPTTVQIPQGEDGEVARLEKDRGMHEAGKWLVSDPRHAIRGMDGPIAKSFILDVQHSGAVAVLAFGDGISDRVAVQLPDDADARKRVFAWCEFWEKKFNKRLINDCKQRYLLLHTPEDAFLPSLR